jgi:hypothetical protein
MVGLEYNQQSVVVEGMELYTGLSAGRFWYSDGNRVSIAAARLTWGESKPLHFVKGGMLSTWLSTSWLWDRDRDSSGQEDQGEVLHDD